MNGPEEHVQEDQAPQERVESEWVVDLATGRIVRRERAQVAFLVERSETVRRWYRYGPGARADSA